MNRKLDDDIYVVMVFTCDTLELRVTNKHMLNKLIYYGGSINE